MYLLFPMQRLILISITLIMSINYSCRTTRTSPAKISGSDQNVTTGYSVNFMEQTTWLLGYFNRERIQSPPHSEWYLKGYDSYQPDQLFINKLLSTPKDDLTVKIVLGTWCPDSRREVPHFMRIMDLWGFPSEKITFIGVDNMKIAPVGEYEALDIQRVPTFIFYKNNIEAGRIIEVPLTSLEQDMVNILNRE